METNFSTREVNIKIVYYGPGLSGKTTNLEVIHSRTPEDNRSRLTAVATDQDRTLFFDYMALELGEICGLKVRLKLFTVPGQVYYNATRKLVLRCVDGVIFVADSQEEKKQENLESLANLRDNLMEYGTKLEEIPLIMQFNKRDLPNAMPLELMDSILNSQLKAPWFPAVAVKGDGVFQCIKNVANMTLAKVEDNIKRRPSKVVKPTEPMPSIKPEPKEPALTRLPEQAKTPLPFVQPKPPNSAQATRGRIVSEDTNKRPNIVLNRAAANVAPQATIARTANVAAAPAGKPPLFAKDKGSTIKIGPSAEPAHKEQAPAKPDGKPIFVKMPSAKAPESMPAPPIRMGTGGGMSTPAGGKKTTGNEPAIPFGNLFQGSLMDSGPSSEGQSPLPETKTPVTPHEPKRVIAQDAKTPVTPHEAKKSLALDHKTPVTPHEAKKSLALDHKTPVTPHEAKKVDFATPSQPSLPVHEAANLEKWNEMKKADSMAKAQSHAPATAAKVPMFTQQKTDEDTKELKASLKNLKKYKQMMGDDS